MIDSSTHAKALCLKKDRVFSQSLMIDLSTYAKASCLKKDRSSPNPSFKPEWFKKPNTSLRLSLHELKERIPMHLISIKTSLQKSLLVNMFPIQGKWQPSSTYTHESHKKDGLIEPLLWYMHLTRFSRS